MGCGSSSTTVQTFTPDNKREDSWIRNDKHSRKSSASSVKSSASRKKIILSSPPRTPPQKPSSASRRTPGKNSRENSANTTSRTYTVHDHQSNGEDTTQVQTLQNNNNNEADWSNMPFSPIEPTESREERHERRAKEIEAIWARGSNKKQKVELPKASNMAFTTIEPTESREEKHERRAREIEAVWAKDCDAQLEAELERFGIGPLEIPPRDEDPIREVTADDICSFNESGGDWFKYGRKVYSKEKLKSIILDRCCKVHYERAKENLEHEHMDTMYMARRRGVTRKKLKQNRYRKVDTKDDIEPLEHEHMDTMNMARRHGVTRKELKQVLAVCHVANVIDIPRDQYLSKQKEFHEFVLDEVQNAESETLIDMKNQTLSWLEAYPNVDESHIVPGSDPNEAVFPLSQRLDPNTIRQWIEAWEQFETDVPADGVWPHLRDEPPVIDGEPYAFAENLKINEGPEYTQLDTSIAGEAGWDLIELDLFKNDIVTEKQEGVWKSRETRDKYFLDQTWMEKRRLEFYNAIFRYQPKFRFAVNREVKKPFCDIYLNIGNTWKQLQVLSESDLIPSEKNVSTVNGIDMKQSEDIYTRADSDIVTRRTSSRSNSRGQQVEDRTLEHGVALGSRASSARSNGSRKGSANSTTRGIAEDANNAPGRISSAHSNGSRKGSANSVNRCIAEDAGNAPERISSAQSKTSERISSARSNGSRRGSANSATRVISEDATNAPERISSARSHASERISSAQSNSSRKGSANSVNRGVSGDADNAPERISSAQSKASEKISSARSNGSRKGSANSTTRVISEDATNAPERISSARSNASERISSANSNGSRKGSANSANRGVSEDAGNAPERLSSAQSNGSRKGSANSATRGISENASNAPERISSARSNASERISSAKSNGSRKGSANSATRVISEDASNAPERLSSARSNSSRKGSVNSVTREISEVKPASNDGLARDGNQIAQNGHAPDIETMDSGLDLNSPEH